MKFKTERDQLQYKLLGLNEDTIKKRLTIADKRKKPKDLAAARNSKNNWRRNKNNIIKGMKKWHDSTDGKRFHRALGRFNSLRESAAINQYYKDLSAGNDITISYDNTTDGLLALSSIETHLLLELQYYEPDFETLQEYLYIIKMFMSDVQEIKDSLLKSYKTGAMSEDLYVDMVEIIQLFLDPKSYLYVKRDERNLSNDINTEDNKLQEELTKLTALDDSNIKEMYDEIDKF